MRNRAFLVTAVAVAAMLVAGGLFASNMGFKLNYQLQGPGGGSLSGTSTVSLPYNAQTNLNNALDLIQDINAAAGASVVVAVSQFVKTNDGLNSYDGVAGTAFALVPGQGYRVAVNASVNYIIVGSHDPGLVIGFDGPGTNGSLSGTNSYAYPYHATSANASDLIAEINAAAGAGVVVAVSQFVKSNDGLNSYDGVAGTAFALVPGESYRVTVNSDVSFVPSHF